MKKHIILLAFLMFFGVYTAFASEDELGLEGYSKDINSPADANATNIYNAWSENMAYRIENDISEGIIIETNKNTEDYISDGVGNVIIKEGANVGPIINKTDLSDAIVIIKKNLRTRF